MFEFLKLISEIGDTKGMLVFFTLLAILLFYSKFKHESVLAFISATSATAITFMFKNLFQVPRPENMLVMEDGFRFPSGHATIAAVLFTLVCYLSHRHIKSTYFRYLAYTLSFIWLIFICYSRIYLGVHLFVDVFVGSIIGVSMTLLSIKFIYFLEKKGII